MQIASGDDMMDFIRSELRKRGRKVKRVRCSAFNGGASLEQLLSRVKDFLAKDFEIEILVWDNQSAALPPVENEASGIVARELRRLDRFMRANDAYQPGLDYDDLTELSCEYLMLGSRILTVPGRHKQHIAQIPGMIGLVLPDAVAAKNGSVIVRKSPYYMPGRVFILDDMAFISLYLHTGRAGTILYAPKGSTLFERLDRHFSETWRQATGPVMQALGRNQEAESKYWQEQARPTAIVEPRIFLSYRHEDSGWATGRLYDRLIGTYTREGVFLDHQSISAGSKFPAEIAQRLQKCPLAIVMIGPNWLKATDASGRRRLDDPDDWVVAEIDRALKQEKKIFPVQVEGAAMPKEADLPPSIRELANIQGNLPLRFESFAADSKKILEQAVKLAPP